MGNFEAYKTQIAEIGEVYNKMKGIKNKPDFVKVYNRVNDVICKLKRHKGIETSIKKKQDKF